MFSWRAQTLFELGRFAAAAGVFDSLASVPQAYESLGLPDLRPMSARHHVWALTLASTAYAAAGDTARLPRLADSVEHLGALEAYGRDRRLHFYVRGLPLEARGDNAGAAARRGTDIRA